MKVFLATTFVEVYCTNLRVCWPIAFYSKQWSGCYSYGNCAIKAEMFLTPGPVSLFSLMRIYNEHNDVNKHMENTLPLLCEEYRNPWQALHVYTQTQHRKLRSHLRPLDSHSSANIKHEPLLNQHFSLVKGEVSASFLFVIQVDRSLKLLIS